MQDTPPKKITTRYGTTTLDFVVDRNLPAWARRTHPLIRRHLGRFWQVIPLQVDEVFRRFAFFCFIILLTIPIPFVYIIVMPTSLLALMAFVLIIGYYITTLYQLAGDASRGMVQEIEGNTLPLLLSAPIPTQELLLSKISASLWRFSDPMTFIVGLITYTQMPTIMLIYVNLYPLEEYGVLTPLMIIAVYASSIVRIPIEMFMVATLGQYIGLTSSGRSSAMVSALTLVVFYLMIVNLPRFTAYPPLLDMLLNAVMPVVLPALIALGVLRYTRYEIENR